MMNKRIKYCMDLHSDAVQALVYPTKEEKKELKDVSDDEDSD